MEVYHNFCDAVSLFEVILELSFMAPILVKYFFG